MDDSSFVENPDLRKVAELLKSYAPLDEVRTSLAHGVNVNEPLKNGLRLIHYAVHHRHVDAVKLLLVRGSDPNLMDDRGYACMHYASEAGFCHLIRILLHYNARVDFTQVLSGDIGYSYPPRASPADEPLRLALKNGYCQAAELLLKNGANPNGQYYSGFEINFLDPSDAKAVELLLKYGADPNARDCQGLTLLMKACRSRHGLETAQLLLANGADSNAITDEEQRTPLHCAALSGSPEVVQLLISNGARVQLPPGYSKPPPLFFAILKGDLPMLRLLIDLGADINHGSATVGSALHVALTELGEKKLPVVSFLLENGADPNAILSSNGRTVLKPPLGEYFAATSVPDVRIIKKLLKYGARVILEGQRQHPLGILQTLHNIDARDGDEVLDLVASAAESFSVALIDSSVRMSRKHKLVLLQHALEPMPLKHLARICIRTCIGWGPTLVAAIEDLFIPFVLKRYMLFED